MFYSGQIWGRRADEHSTFNIQHPTFNGARSAADLTAIRTMPRIPIIMPQLGESIAEATIVRLPFAVGSEVEADQEIIEVETNKATMGVTTPCSGTLLELKVEMGSTYAVGTVLGYVEVSDEEAKRLGVGEATVESGPLKMDGGPSPTSSVMPVVHGLPVPAHAAGIAYMSPRMKARMNELGLQQADLAGIAGSGAGGRVTIEDLEEFLYRLDEHKQSPASSMRVAVADAMRRSWTRPLATVGRPVRLDALLAHRKASAAKSGPALYALRALAIALGENSAAAGRLVGGKIVHPKAIDVGFAVEAEDGVLVPVLRNADTIPLAAGAFYPIFGWLLSPMIAGVAMSFSSVSVVMNALRLRHANLSPEAGGK